MESVPCALAGWVRRHRRGSFAVTSFSGPRAIEPCRDRVLALGACQLCCCNALPRLAPLSLAPPVNPHNRPGPPAARNALCANRPVCLSVRPLSLSLQAGLVDRSMDECAQLEAGVLRALGQAAIIAADQEKQQQAQRAEAEAAAAAAQPADGGAAGGGATAAAGAAGGSKGKGQREGGSEAGGEEKERDKSKKAKDRSVAVALEAWVEAEMGGEPPAVLQVGARGPSHQSLRGARHGAMACSCWVVLLRRHAVRTQPASRVLHPRHTTPALSSSDPPLPNICRRCAPRRSWTLPTRRPPRRSRRCARAACWPPGWRAYGRRPPRPTSAPAAASRCPGARHHRRGCPGELSCAQVGSPLPVFSPPVLPPPACPEMSTPASTPRRPAGSRARRPATGAAPGRRPTRGACWRRCMSWAGWRAGAGRRASCWTRCSATRGAPLQLLFLAQPLPVGTF